jgi:3-deoxy-D-manno-octulosonate 8-phosphate phosphatase (KDO 8-P phosphatase)
MEQILKNIKLIFFDFDGVFTNNTVIVDENGKESVICNRSDGIGLSRLESGGVKLIIVSTEINPVVTARGKKLKIKVFQGIENKLKLVQSIMEDEFIDPSEVIFVGNDINDIPAMKFVGCSVAPADSFSEVKQICNILLKKNGGYGAVREICDMVSIAKSIKSKYEY